MQQLSLHCGLRKLLAANSVELSELAGARYTFKPVRGFGTIPTHSIIQRIIFPRDNLQALRHRAPVLLIAAFALSVFFLSNFNFKGIMEIPSRRFSPPANTSNFDAGSTTA